MSNSEYRMSKFEIVDNDNRAEVPSLLTAEEWLNSYKDYGHEQVNNDNKDCNT
jgi:hypothetical protein